MADSQHELSSSLQSVLVHIAEASALADKMEKAWLLGDGRARNFYFAAEQEHGALLKLICALSEQDANLAEPNFTAFEGRILRLSKQMFSDLPS